MTYCPLEQQPDGSWICPACGWRWRRQAIRECPATTPRREPLAEPDLRALPEEQSRRLLVCKVCDQYDAEAETCRTYCRGCDARMQFRIRLSSLTWQCEKWRTT